MPLANTQLHIIDEKYVDIAVFLTEFGHCGVVAVSDSLDDFIGKFFTRYVENPRRRVLLKNKMCDRVQDVYKRQITLIA